MTREVFKGWKKIKGLHFYYYLFFALRRMLIWIDIILGGGKKDFFFRKHMSVFIYEWDLVHYKIMWRAWSWGLADLFNLMKKKVCKKKSFCLEMFQRLRGFLLDYNPRFFFSYFILIFFRIIPQHFLLPFFLSAIFKFFFAYGYGFAFPVPVPLDTNPSFFFLFFAVKFFLVKMIWQMYN